jgi:hypothetical protein
MKQALQIALLGLFGICAVPSALHAQDRDDHRRYQSHERYDRGYRNDDYAYRGGGYGYSYQAPYDYERERRGSVNRSVAIVGGGAAAGALIGAAAGHGQGAAIGAFVGGITGLIVDQSTRNHRHYDRY